MRRPPAPSFSTPPTGARASLFEEQAQAHTESRRGLLRWAPAGPMPLLRN